ncbi:hypothetical protein [Acetobacter pasteurianus]|nr:hypothetical protein [Acetobacter pasteurianus]
MATERLTTYAGAICTALLPAALVLLIAAGLATPDPVTTGHAAQKLEAVR